VFFLAIGQKTQEREKPELDDVQGEADIIGEFREGQKEQSIPEQSGNTCRIQHKKDHSHLHDSVDSVAVPFARNTAFAGDHFAGGGGGGGGVGGITGMIPLV
jgi:hypothetical protein